MNPVRTSLLIASVSTVFSFAQAQSKVPDGWFRGGSNVGMYEVKSDIAIKHTGYASVNLRSIRDSVPGFGTVAQLFKADEFVNRRVRFSAFVKTGEITGSAGLWMRVDDIFYSNQPLSFDNMRGRPIRGNTEWRQYAIVLDVPPEAGTIVIGVLLNGGGTLWLDDVTVEVVDQNVPSTDTEAPRRRLPNRPSNLDFEQ